MKKKKPISNYTDSYNRLMNVINHHPDEFVVKRAETTLGGWMTAGGPNILRNEAVQLLSETEEWEKELLKK